MLAFFLFLISFGVLFFLVDFLQKKVITSLHWSRKATHVLSGPIIFLMPLSLTGKQVFWLAFIFVLVLTISKWNKILSLHNVERKTIGEVLYPLSICILSILCLPEHTKAFQIGTLVLAFSDGFSGIIGEALNFHTIHIFGNKKSLGGALTFFIVTFLILSGYHGFVQPGLIVIIGLSALLAGLEFILIYGSDNLVLPIATALIEIYLMN